MKAAIVLSTLAAALAAAMHAVSSGASGAEQSAARETRIPVGNATLYARDVGEGPPVIVLHGGPDFDHSYFLPDMDRLSDGYRLIYYDQRGRGKSADGVQPEDVTLESELADLEKVRRHFQLGTAAVLGHSWGGVLALEYAIRHPDRVSHAIIMNPAPVSAADYLRFRKQRVEMLGGDLDRLKAVSATAAYKEGEPEAVYAYYRIHFKSGLKQPEHYERLMTALRASFVSKAGILKARRIEDRLMNDTWLSTGYDLLPKLSSLRVPTLVIYGEHDFIPADTAAARIGEAIPNARLAAFKDCGHFAFLECPDAVRKELDDFFGSAKPPGRLW